MAFPVGSSLVDVNGHFPLVSSDIQDILSVDLSGSAFLSPDISFSGFAANGDGYTDGVPNSTRASWATETENLHRGPANGLPRRFFVFLTDVEVSIVDAEDFTLVLRSIAAGELELGGSPIPGIFLEWVLDDSVSSRGTLLGKTSSTFRQLAWSEGRLFVATSDGLRILDFRGDRGYALRDDGFYQYGLAIHAGLQYRNKPDYFSVTPESGPFTGVTDVLSVTARRLGGNSYVIQGLSTGVQVFSWWNQVFPELVALTSLGGAGLSAGTTTDGT